LAYKVLCDIVPPAKPLTWPDFSQKDFGLVCFLLCGLFIVFFSSLLLALGQNQLNPVPSFPDDPEHGIKQQSRELPCESLPNSRYWCE